MMNIFAKIGDNVELWTDENWSDFNKWKLERLQMAYEHLDAASEKTEEIILQLERLKYIIDLLKKQVQPQDSSSDNKLED